MANPLYSMFGGQNTDPIMSSFQNFMESMKGKNPNAILNDIISSGKINQEQLNAIQQQAQSIYARLNGMKGMFGFK